MTAKTLCPKCGYFLDMHREVRGRQAQPRPGDNTICLNCGEISVFEEDMQLRLLTEDDIAAFPPDEIKLVHRAQRAWRDHFASLGNGILFNPSDDTKQ